MRRVLKNILISSVLLCTILLIVIFHISFFTGGPMVLNEKEDTDTLTLMATKNKLHGCVLDSRFSDDQVYYVAICDDTVVFYDQEGMILSKRQRTQIAYDTVKQKLAELMNSSDIQISLGYYHQTPVYVLSNEERELLADFDTYELLRNWQKG